MPDFDTEARDEIAERARTTWPTATDLHFAWGEGHLDVVAAYDAHGVDLMEKDAGTTDTFLESLWPYDSNLRNASVLTETLNSSPGLYRLNIRHQARPDDDPEPGDRCKDCGKPITWMGPSQYDWEHA